MPKPVCSCVVKNPIPVFIQGPLIGPANTVFPTISTWLRFLIVIVRTYEHEFLRFINPHHALMPYPLFNAMLVSLHVCHVMCRCSSPVKKGLGN